MHTSRRAVLAAFPALIGAAGAMHGAAAGMERSSLAQVARRAGRSFGAALRSSEVAAEPLLSAAVLRDCNQVSPEVHLMWKALEPEAGRFDYAEMDRLAAFASDANLKLHGHALLWHDAVPSWARARLGDGGGDWSLVAGHLRSTLTRYASRIGDWTVVNEPLAPDPRGRALREAPFLRAFGPDYIGRALAEAHAIAPRARLFINEYGLEYDNPVDEARRRELLRLVGELKRRRVPLHGVGLQSHLDLSKGPLAAERLRRFLADLAALDVKIAITELDVQENDFSAPVPVRDARVAAEVAAYLDVALEQPAVRSVTCWGLTDRHSWLQGADRLSRDGEAVAITAARRNRGLPYDAGLQPKALYWALHRSLDRPGVRAI